jgi:hypothetical protein
MALNGFHVRRITSAGRPIFVRVVPTSSFLTRLAVCEALSEA